MKNIFLATAVTLAIAGCSTDDVQAPDDVNSFGQLEVSGDAEAGQTLTALVTDADGIADGAVSYQWHADGVDIAGATSSTYMITTADEAAKISVTVNYTDNARNDETIKSDETSAVTLPVVNGAATFAGDLATTITNDTSSAVTGAITVSDDDASEAMATAQTDTVGMYGTFSITADGAWTYTLADGNSTVDSLADASDSVVETLPITSVDGTTTDVVITITGVTSAGAMSQVAKISDSMSDDAGELRYKLSSSDIIEAGKISVSFMKDANVVNQNGDAKDAYIALYGTSTSTSAAIVDLRIGTDSFVIRDQDGIDVTIPFTPGVWTDVEMTWDASAASSSVAPLVTITIDGTSVTTDAFSSASSDLGAVEGGVQTVVFKLADTSSVITDAYYHIDDFKLYADMSGTIQFEDDFESYTVGDSLDDDNSSSPYNGSTADAVVASVEKSDPVVVAPVDNQMAKISDSMGDDAGELRYKLSSSDIIEAGKLTVSFLKDDNVVNQNGDAKDAYIAVYGTSTSTSAAIVDLRIGVDAFAIRDQDGIDVDIPFTPGVWTDVEITWDASAASGTVAPMVTVSINGTSVTTEAFSSASSDLGAVEDGVQTVIFKLADTSSIITDAAYYVDDIKLYSDLAGTTVQFEDDFESYSVGDSLDDDNSASPYNGSTADAVVVKE
jgi:VCBS repeat-containing protein